MKRLAATNVVAEAPQQNAVECRKWRPAVEHIGMDVHKRESQLCIISGAGEVFEQRIRTERGRFLEVLGKREPAKILLEASTESEWVAQCLEELGHEVVVADPNFAPMYGTRTRRVKTDRRDARALADAYMSGTYRKAHRTSEPRRQLKAHLAVRDALVRERAKHLVLMSALVRQQGLRVATGSADHFLDRLGRLELPPVLKAAVAPLVEVVELLNAKLAEAERRLEEMVEADTQMAKLCTMPSVGPVTAAAFVAVVDDAGRFEGAHQLEAYLGLVPSELSSGEKQRRGRITKTGSSRMRALLVQVALSTMRLRKASTRGLWEWAGRLEAKRGRKVAAVALGRKVAGILYAMMRDGTEFKAWPGRDEVARA
jgi:transposase